MLDINNQKASISDAKFIFNSFTLNGVPCGYLGFIMITFELNGIKGYLNFDIGNIPDKDFGYYENKEFECIPFDDHTKISLIELFDTKVFYNHGEFYNAMNVKFGKIKNNKIEVKIRINEEFTDIYFNDYIELNNEEKK